MTASRAAVFNTEDAVSERLGRSADGAPALFQLAGALRDLEASPLAVAQLTDAIEQSSQSSSNEPLDAAANFLRRERRKQLLTKMLRADRAAYVETVSFLSIPRDELPNRQDVPLRACDPPPRAGATLSSALVDGMTTDGLVPDCALDDVAMGENAAEAALLSVTRDIYAAETGMPRVERPGIAGLVEEMRTFMLTPDGSVAETQQAALLRTLYVLMTPVLPPFYRIFMGGLVPSTERSDPKWLVDAVQSAAERLDALPFWNATAALAPGRQLGPLPYAPALTSVVAPYVFGFLVGPASLNRRSDGEVGGLVVHKCKFLQESSCKGMCLNSCKLPAQQLFSELGLPLRVIPNFETQECQWSFGEAAPEPVDDPTWPKGCVQGCTSREAMKELSGGGVTARACA